MKFWAMTVDVVNGRTYWQKGSFESRQAIIEHVNRYSGNQKHIQIFQTTEHGLLEFLEHVAAGTY